MLCTWLSSDSLQGVRREVRRLLVATCGSHQAYRTCRYFFKFHVAVRTLEPLLPLLRSPNYNTHHLTTALAVLKHLRAVIDERTKAWSLFGRHNPPVLPALVAAALAGPPPARRPIIGLVRLAIDKAHHMLREGASAGDGEGPSADEDLLTWVFPGDLLTWAIR